MRHPQPRSYCPINLSLEIFGDRWTLLVLRDLMLGGKRHFRELQNVIERAVILSQRGPFRVDLALQGSRATSRGGRTLRLNNLAETRSSVLSEAEMSRRKRDNILAALERTGWKISGAARMLGVKPTTLASRLKRLGIERPL